MAVIPTQSRKVLSIKKNLSARQLIQADNRPACRRFALLELNDLKVHYPVRGGFFQRVVDQVKAVDGVSIDNRPACRRFSAAGFSH
jgi:ABC-type microcin C transport system duplicated ATPase subunit YejF